MAWSRWGGGGGKIEVSALLQHSLRLSSAIGVCCSVDILGGVGAGLLGIGIVDMSLVLKLCDSFRSGVSRGSFVCL